MYITYIMYAIRPNRQNIIEHTYTSFENIQEQGCLSFVRRIILILLNNSKLYITTSIIAKQENVGTI